MKTMKLREGTEFEHYLKHVVEDDIKYIDGLTVDDGTQVWLETNRHGHK